MKYGVPQGSVLEQLFFWSLINNLNYGIKLSTTFYFADGTCLCNVTQSINKLKKDLKISYIGSMVTKSLIMLSKLK